MIVHGFRDAEQAREYYTRQRVFAVKLTIAIKRLLASVLPDSLSAIAEDIPSIACEWYCANCDAAIMLAGEFEKMGPGPVHQPYEPPPIAERLANLVHTRDAILDSITKQESALDVVSDEGSQGWADYLRLTTLDPQRAHLAEIERSISALTAQAEGGVAAELPRLGRLYSGGLGLYPSLSSMGPAGPVAIPIGGSTLGAMSKDNPSFRPSDTPVDHEKEEVPITYRKAQNVQSLVNGLGYNTPGDTDGISLNARNSGTPSTAAEAAQWQKDRPGTPYIPPITPESFKPMTRTEVGNIDSDHTNLNKPNRVLLLVLRKDQGPASVVMTADDFTDDTGKLLDPAEADSKLIERFSPSNPFNQ